MPLRVLFSAHGLPEVIVKAGDPYQWQVEQTVAAVMAAWGETVDHTICYQSRATPQKWIDPSTDGEVERAAKDRTAVLVVPIAFVSEHTETLVELDVEYRDLAVKLGVPGYFRVPTQNADAGFIASLAGLVRRARSCRTGAVQRLRWPAVRRGARLMPILGAVRHVALHFVACYSPICHVILLQRDDRRLSAGRARMVWELVSFATILALGFILRLYALARNGFGNEYYSAGVFSMTRSLHNFFFNAFDPAGILALDKPPIALWVQVASARLFGFEPLSVLMPQAIEGMVSVVVVWHLVRRQFGAKPGLLAALLMAITPISVAVDRSSNTDSCLVMVLLLAAWALLVAAECGSWRLLLLAMALVGVAFNVKMMAAFVVLPVFALTYWLGDAKRPGHRWRRPIHLAAGGVVCFAVSVTWIGAVELTPAFERPFVDSSPTNSMLDLVVGHNGLQRFLPRGGPVEIVCFDRTTCAGGTIASHGPSVGQPGRLACPPGADRRRIGPGRAASRRAGRTESDPVVRLAADILGRL